MTETDLSPGQRVIVVNDGDGAEGQPGTIRTAYKSGRYCVDLDCGGFRNLPRTAIEVAK